MDTLLPLRPSATRRVQGIDHLGQMATPERCRAYARLAEEVARSRTVAAEMALFLASGLLGATLPHYFDRNHWWELGAVGCRWCGHRLRRWPAAAVLGA